MNQSKPFWGIRVFASILLFFIVFTVYPAGVQASDGTEDETQSSYKKYGIDVSRWQGEIDFEKVKEDGVEFVIMRAGYSGTKDFMFETYYEDAKNAGLGIGCYIYSYAQTTAEARQDAVDLMDWIKGKTFDYPVYFDIEDECQQSLTNEERTDLCIAFLSEMKEKNYYAGVYASKHWFVTQMELSRLSDYPLWIASWTSTGEDTGDFSYAYGMWQYTSKGSVDGIPGNVDRDVCYVDYPAYIKEYEYNGYRELEYDPDLPFTDVKKSSWYYDGIKYVYERNLMNGMSTTAFSPDKPLTRGMFVTIIGRMSDVDVEEYTKSRFLDVDMTRYYGPYIAWAHENEIVSGMGNDLFEPEAEITREQMCRMISNYASYAQITLSGEYTQFADEDEIAGWALDSVKELTAAGIILGMGSNLFCPQKNATRAQCATIIQRFEDVGRQES